MPAVIAVVPTFYPDSDLASRISALAEQVDAVVVVDDGTKGSSPALEAVAVLDGASVLKLPANGGIAGALNIGTRIALERGADFVLHLDQDTDLPIDYVQVALATFQRANPVTNVGVVCVDAVNGAPSLPTWTSPEGLGLVPEAIQTGFVISRHCLEAAGLMDERLVIDCVDTEFCLRIREHGFHIAIAAGTNIRHAIGRRAELRPFGIPLRHSNGRIATYQYHSPFRRYYIARNNVDLMLRYARTQPGWVVRVIVREAGGMITSIVSGPQRLAQLLAILVGTSHGLARRRGLIPIWLKRMIS